MNCTWKELSVSLPPRLAVITRVRDFDTLARKHLYQVPPTNLLSLHFGRDNEPVAVDLYCKTFPSRTVSASGLIIIHPDIPYIAASPDRLVMDPERTPPDGLMEVKCLFVTKNVLVEAAKEGKGGCLKIVDGVCKVDTDHKYYYQVQHQMACAKRFWCDLVVFSAGTSFCERINFEPEK